GSATALAPDRASPGRGRHQMQARIAAMSTEPQGSVVLPIYNEADNLPDLVERVGEALERSRRTYELICIDDGSRDASARTMAELAQTRPWFKPLYLIRNYGQ